MNITDKLSAILDNKYDIKEAIQLKGQSLSGIPLSGYAEKINSIKTEDIFYKCINKNPIYSSSFDVSGSTETYVEVNGTYELLSGSGIDRVWKSEHNVYCFYSNIGGYGTYKVMFHINIGDKSQLPQNSLTYSSDNFSQTDFKDPWEYSEWKYWDGTVLPNFKVINDKSVELSGTWTGYEATITSTGITYNTSIISTFTYMDIFPITGAVYNDDLSKRILTDNIIPQNIKKDTNILGINGIYEDNYYKCTSI